MLNGCRYNIKSKSHQWQKKIHSKNKKKHQNANMHTVCNKNINKNKIYTPQHHNFHNYNLLVRRANNTTPRPDNIMSRIY